MPKRRESIAPQTEIDVLKGRIVALENQVKALRQPGPSYLQADDMNYEGAPVPWQMMVNHPGAHIEATPADPVVYYHPGDETAGGTTPAGFKAIGASTVPWVALYDDFLWGHSVLSSRGIENIYFPNATQQNGSEGIFEITVDDTPPPEVSSFQIVTVTLKQPGIYAFHLSVHWSGGDRAHVFYGYILDGVPYIGQVVPLETRRIRDLTGWNDWDFWDDWQIIVPVPLVGTSIVTPKIIWDANWNGEVISDTIYARMWIQYFGPLGSYTEY